MTDTGVLEESVSMLKVIGYDLSKSIDTLKLGLGSYMVPELTAIADKLKLTITVLEGENEQSPT